MPVQIQFRRGTAAQWTAINPILAEGEMGVETDTNLFKIGNGSAAWNSLSYGGLQGATGIQGGPTFTVTNSGTTDYLFNGAAEPTLNLIRGFTYYFIINAADLPFWIKTSPVTGTGSAYTSGITNNGTDSGTITFVVPYNAPSQLYYICQVQAGMTGNINISDLGPTGATGAQGATGPAPAVGKVLTMSMIFG